MVEPQILPLVAVKQPDPAKKWQNEKLRGKKDKWNAACAAKTFEAIDELLANPSWHEDGFQFNTWAPLLVAHMLKEPGYLMLAAEVDIFVQLSTS